MSDLKDSWKGVGHNFSQAWKGLGKSVVKSVATGARKAESWANGDNNNQNAAQAQNPNNNQNQNAAPAANQNPAPNPTPNMVNTNGVEVNNQGNNNQ